MTLYIWFSFPYFYYDTIMMYFEIYYDEKKNDPTITHSWRSIKLFVYKKTTMIIHHCIIPIIGVPTIVVSPSFLLL